MEATQNAEVIELSLEKTIETKLVQANVTETVLAALKEKYGGLKLKALDDKESYLELKAAAKDCAKLRTETVKVCKKGREDAVKEQKAWIKKEKEVVDEIATVEDPLDAEIKRFDDEQERLANEEKNRQEEAYINRQAALTKMGAVYANGEFTLGAASFEANLIKGSSEDVWQESVLPKFQAEHVKIMAAELEVEKKKQEADAELKRQQDELAEKNRKFEEEQAAFKKQQEATALLEKERIAEEERKQQQADSKKFSERMELLQGWSYNGTFAKGMGNSTYSKPEIINLSDSDFSELVKANHDYIAAQEKAAEEKRLADIEDAKQKAIQAEKERVAEQARLDEIKKKQEEEKRIAELEAAKDKTKWQEFLKQLSVIDTFEMKSSQYKKRMQIAIEKIEEIKAL